MERDDDASVDSGPPSGPPLVLDVSVQSTRFHETALSAINLHGITITVGGEGGGSSSDDDGADGTAAAATDPRELLTDADLNLTAGTKYALVGRNGSGKSILLKVLASGALFDPDAQLALRIQLVTQSFAPPPRPDWTVIEEVNTPPFGFDLSEALNASKRAQRRAELRSGRRGKEARSEAVARSAAGTRGSDDKDAVVAPVAAASSFDDVPLPSPAEIAAAFKVLGVPITVLDQRYASLSGGWRMRVTLAKALIYSPSVLLLDEPTNHLDIVGINALIALLRSEALAETTVVFVTHDLYFINAVAQATIQLQDCKLIVAAGNWDTLQRERIDRKKYTERYAAERERESERLLASLDASMRKAGRDDKLRKQLASRREKVLERGAGMMRDSKGHRYKRNDAENAGYHETVSSSLKIDMVREERPVAFHFDSPALGRGVAGGAGAGGGGVGSATMLAVDGLAFSYVGAPGGGGAKAGVAPPATGKAGSASSALPGSGRGGNGAARGGSTAAARGSTRPVAPGRGAATPAAPSSSSTTAAATGSGGFNLELDDLNLAAGERLILLGPNGHGKSTLLRLLVGELLPTRGSVRISSPRVGYFEQHAVARLGGEHDTALHYILKTRKAAGLAAGVSGDDEEAKARKALGSFGLGPHTGTPVALLSGGQRVALEFVLLALLRPALLLLDEPSAHLDLQAREGLARALAAFEGAAIFVSHDVGFIELAQPTRALLCKGGRFTPIDAENWKRVALAL